MINYQLLIINESSITIKPVSINLTGFLFGLNKN